MNVLKFKSRWLVLPVFLLALNGAHARAVLPVYAVPGDEQPASIETALQNQSGKGSMVEKLLTRIAVRKLEKYARKHGLSAPESKGKKKKSGSKGDSWNGVAMGLGIASMPFIALAFTTLMPGAAVFLVLGIISGVLGLVFGIVGVKNEYKHKGMGIAGIITGGISMGTLLITLLALTIAAIIIL